LPEPTRTDPRFTDNGDETITDRLTGLIWAKKADTPTIGAFEGGAMQWMRSFEYIEALNAASYLGHNDWRVPDISELESLVAHRRDVPYEWLAEKGFENVVLASYWSATTYAANTDSAWDLCMYDGRVSNNYKTKYQLVWPVCGRQLPS
jgi:hypothetical protein